MSEQGSAFPQVNYGMGVIFLKKLFIFMNETGI